MKVHISNHKLLKNLKRSAELIAITEYNTLSKSMTVGIKVSGSIVDEKNEEVPVKDFVGMFRFKIDEQSEKLKFSDWGIKKASMIENEWAELIITYMDENGMFDKP